jgi:RNA polymerase sigma-70 factor (ECF subfamily)
VDEGFRERLTRGRNGDANALEELFARWRPLLRLDARRLLGAELAARIDPSDVAQETLTQAFEDLSQFRGQSEGEWVTWLRCIVAGQAAKARRFHGAAKRNPGREQACTPNALPGRERNPAVQAMDQEQARCLAAAIEDLPRLMREVVMQRAVHQEPFEKVAQLLGISPGAARVLWTRALRRLRELLS